MDEGRASHIALLALFPLVVDAFKAEFGDVQEEEGEEEEEEAEDAKLGVPINEADSSRENEFRATNFLLDPPSLWINLLWCQVASSTMILHAMLSKNATWFTCRQVSAGVVQSATFVCHILRPLHKPSFGQFPRAVDLLERSRNMFGSCGLAAWPCCTVASATAANCKESYYGGDRPAGTEIDFALAAAGPLALSGVDEEKRKERAQDQLLLLGPWLVPATREGELLSSDAHDFLSTVFQRLRPLP